MLGEYGKRFGSPRFSVKISDGKISGIEVIRGAPCGATWAAALDMIGCAIEKASIEMGLKSQMHCVADPSGWDPISGKSPVHIAGELHSAALKKVLYKLLNPHSDL